MVEKEVETVTEQNSERTEQNRTVKEQNRTESVLMCVFHHLPPVRE